MTTEEFKKLGYDIYGYGWRKKLAAETGISYTSIKRYAKGQEKIPKLLELFLQILIDTLR